MSREGKTKSRQAKSLKENEAFLSSLWSQTYRTYLLAPKVSLVDAFVPSRAKFPRFSLKMGFKRPLWAKVWCPLHFHPFLASLSVPSSRR